MYCTIYKAKYVDGNCCRVALKREEAVAREVMKKVADDKKMSKKEKDERYRKDCVLELRQ